MVTALLMVTKGLKAIAVYHTSQLSFKANIMLVPMLVLWDCLRFKIMCVCMFGRTKGFGYALFMTKILAETCYCISMQVD